MTTTALRLHACPRCNGPLAKQRDQYGPYWQCFRCGFHLDVDMPPERRIPHVGAANIFDYYGPNEAFKRTRVRGMLLNPKSKRSDARFDLGCPFPECEGRMSRTKLAYRMVRINWEAYICENQHRIFINLGELIWE
jgi:uncharacterized protein YbaR (Trm112 family)